MHNTGTQPLDSSSLMGIGLGPGSPITLLLNSSQTGIIIAFIGDGVFQFLNKKALDYCQITQDQAETMSLAAILDGLHGVDEDGHPLKKEDYPIWSSLYGEGNDSLIFRKTTDDGTTTFVMQSSLVHIDAKTKGTLTTLEDITETVTINQKFQDTVLRLENLWRASSQASITVKEVCDITLDAVIDITKSQYGFYGFITDDEQRMLVHAWSGETMQGCSVIDKPCTFLINESGVWAEAVRQRKPLILNDYAAYNKAKRGYPPGHIQLDRLMVVPFFIGKTMHSVAAVANKHFDYTYEETETVANFLSDIYSVIKRLELENALQISREQYKKLAITDSLTGLFNRRYFFDALEAEFSRAERSSSSLAIILFDLDFFKKINDTYGHSAGDLTLREVTACLLSSLRKIDTASRFGGEEFIVALPGTTLDRAVVVAERIRRCIETHPMCYQNATIRITASFGVSAHTGRNSQAATAADAINALINQADKALYAAKHAGRNRVFTTQGPAAPDIPADPSGGACGWDR